MLRLPPFSYYRPTTTREAAAMLADHGPGARVVAGGTDLWPNMKRRHQTASTVISLMRIPELRQLEGNGDKGDLKIGATASLTQVAASALVRNRYPALARAIDSISSPPLRNMGTLGGNLCLDTRCTYYNQTEGWRRSIDYCMKEAGTVCWVAPSSPRCWAHSASDSAPILAALDATVDLVSTTGQRTIPVDELFLDDGINYLAKRPDELLTEVRLAPESGVDHCRSSFWKLRRRGSIDFAVLSVGAAVWFDDHETVRRARLFLGAVGSRPIRVTGLEEILIGQPLTGETIAQTAERARKLATPMDNTDFKTQWRGWMVARYTEAALREIAGLDPGLAPPAMSASPFA